MGHVQNVFLGLDRVGHVQNVSLGLDRVGHVQNVFLGVPHQLRLGMGCSVHKKWQKHAHFQRAQPKPF